MTPERHWFPGGSDREVGLECSVSRADWRIVRFYCSDQDDGSLLHNQHLYIAVDRIRVRAPDAILSSLFYTFMPRRILQRF